MHTLYLMVSQIAAQLQAEGKQPSLALVRARAGKDFNPAQLFSAFQQWKANPPLNSTDNSAAERAITSNQADVDDSIASNTPQLNADLQRIEAKLDRILLLLEQGLPHVDR